MREPGVREAVCGLDALCSGVPYGLILRLDIGFSGNHVIDLQLSNANVNYPADGRYLVRTLKIGGCCAVPAQLTYIAGAGADSDKEVRTNWNSIGYSCWHCK